MSDDVVTVESYSDVLGHGDISSKDALAVVDALNAASSGGLVIWVREWLVSEKSLETAGSSEQVFAGALERETEKAWQLVQADGTDDWIPKSQAVAFERAPNATLTTPQQRLGDGGAA